MKTMRVAVEEKLAVFGVRFGPRVLVQGVCACVCVFLQDDGGWNGES